MPLHPEIAEFLTKMATSGAKPRSAMTIAETREFAERANALSGPAAELARVFDARLASVSVRFYEPTGAAEARMLFLHGGRFISGNLNSHDSLCRALAAASRCTVVAVDYRLAPGHRFPAALEDCLAVANALSGPLIVCGDSAGGNLAAAAALQLPNRFLAQVLVYPMLDASCVCDSHHIFAFGYGPGSDDMKRGWHEYAAETDLRTPLLSPLWAKDLSGLPPTLILSAEYDSLRDEAEQYARMLIGAEVAVTLKRYEGAVHGFFQMAGIFSLGRIAIRDVADYIRGQLAVSS